MRADYKNTKVGDQIVFKKAGEWHYFLNRIENAKKLVSGQVYTVKKISVASSSTGVILEETNEEVELTWFDKLENMNTEIDTLKQELEQIESTFLPKTDVVEEQRNLIKHLEEKIKETETFTQELEKIKSSYIPIEDENINCTKNVDEWINLIRDNDIKYKNAYGTGLNPDRVEDSWLTECSSLNFDYETIKGASGYITNPVFKHNGKVEAASIKTFTTMQDLRDYLKDKHYLLYMIISSVKTKGCESDSFVPYRLDNTEMKYTFRGHILN
jgi:hypothetical protein